MSKFRIKWNTDRILGLSAMSISVITLAIFIYQTNLLRRQNYIAILPYLQTSTSNQEGNAVFKFNLINHGVGPAIIESMTIYYKEERYKLSEHGDYVYGLLKELEPELDSLKGVSQSSLNRGMAIPSNMTYTIFEIGGQPEEYYLLTGTLQKMLENGLGYEIIYRSIQDERWMIKDNSDGPIKLD